MSFIGNDIIALNDSYNQESFSKSKYIQKILTDEELQYFNIKQSSQYLPYFFWTCKESAYKIVLKEGIDKGFVPQNFNVNSEDVILSSTNPSVATVKSCYITCLSTGECDIHFNYKGTIVPIHIIST